MELATDSAAVSAQSTPDIRRLSARRARNAAGLDGRVRAARRIKAAIAELKTQVGRAVEGPLLRRAAELQVCAEMLRGRLVCGDAGVSVDEVVKLENLASRARRDLQARAKHEPEPQQSLAEYLASLPQEQRADGETPTGGVPEGIEQASGEDVSHDDEARE
jgi:hypothetical protein